MKSFVYHGPPSGVTLEGGKEVLLYPGKTKELPEDNEYVQSLVERRLLIPVDEPKIKSNKKETPNAP